MSEYKKFCESCGEKIAFPAEYIGYQINCPHCQALTLLTDPDAAAVPHQAILPACRLDRTYVFQLQRRYAMQRTRQVITPVTPRTKPRQQPVGLGRKISVRTVGELQHSSKENTKKRAMFQDIARCRI